MIVGQVVGEQLDRASQWFHRETVRVLETSGGVWWDGMVASRELRRLSTWARSWGYPR